MSVGLRAICAAAALTALAACSGGIRGGSIEQAALDAVVGTAGPAPAPVAVTLGGVAQAAPDVLAVTPERLGKTGYLDLVAQRRDATPGLITVWQSSDAAQIVLRDGVLVTTRGVGRDLLSSDVTSTIAAVTARRSGAGERSMVLQQGDNTYTTLRLQCDIANLGQAPLAIGSNTLATTRLRETCRGPTGTFANDYWVQSGNNKIRKSRQWVGPTVGYYTILVLEQ